MTRRNEIVSYLDDFLCIGEIRDKSRNGLQVQGTENITRVALATDAALATYEKAAAAGAQMMLVHHGFIWGGIDSITGRNYEHIRFLIANNMNLYAAHLPLDMHPEVGNNALLANMAGLKKIRPFGKYMESAVGFGGNLPAPMAPEELQNVLEQKLDTRGQLVAFGPPEIRTVAIVSGGGASTLTEAIGSGYDCLITGEGSHEKYHEAREGKIHLMYLGHYKTETVGVKALGKKLEQQFPDIETVFIDEPTGY
jgi:dinuclear metal center YbgI/SA1388 family protein